MTTTKEFLKEVKEQDLEERQVEVEAIGLGLNKIGRSCQLEDTPSIRGMINKVKHLVIVS